MDKKTKQIKFTSEEAHDLMKLFKHVGPLYQEQQDFIWWGLKRYIDPEHPKPIPACNCTLSYAAAFNKLRDWYSQNGEKFQ